MQKTNQEKVRIGKVLKSKIINCTSNGKDMIVALIVGMIKKTSYKWVNTFLNRLEFLEEILTLIFQIMQQKRI